MFQKDGYYFLKPLDAFRDAKFVVFIDVDNTITSGPSAWEHLHQAFNTVDEGRVHTELFFKGKIDYGKWAELDVGLWKGRHIREVHEALSDIRARPGAKSAIRKLQEEGAFVVLISGGLIALVERLAKEIGADAFVANDFILDDEGRIVGPCPQYVSMEKDDIAKNLMSFMNGRPHVTTIAIGDSVNDISLFKWADFSVAFNPSHESVAKAASETVHGEDFHLAIQPALKFIKSITNRKAN